MEKQITVLACDRCGKHAESKCNICGVDLCRDCNGRVCISRPHDDPNRTATYNWREMNVCPACADIAWETIMTLKK